MNRRAIVILTAVVAVLCLAAFAAAKTPIVMVTYGTDTVFERYAKIAEAFNASHPDYELQIQIYPYAEYSTKVTIMIAAGTPPDVFQTWAQNKPAWVEQGMIMDITPYWESSAVAQQAELFPFVQEAGMYKGRMYGVPHDFSAMAWILNTDRLDNAGLAEPDENWTIDDFENYAVRLTRPDQGVYGAQRSGHWSLASYQWSVNFNGQGWLSDDRTEVLVNQPAHVEMLEWWQDLIAREAAPKQGVTPTAGDTWSGGYAMWEGWVHYASRLADSPYNWTMATLPKGPGGNYSLAQGHMWSIPSNATNPDRAWVLLEWLLSPEGQRAMVEIDGRQPLSNDPELWSLFFSSVQPDKQAFMQNFVMNVIYGQNLIHNLNYWTSFADVDRVMNRNLAPVFALDAAPGPAMEQAAAEIRAVMGL